MSLVGPRPEREFFVGQLKEKNSLLPPPSQGETGLTGWAQIKHNYDRSFDM
jgi:lipopolysaccharide/colanic/teichoic acid biosynthesis glycosyltransferase